MFGWSLDLGEFTQIQRGVSKAATSNRCDFCEFFGRTSVESIKGYTVYT